MIQASGVSAALHRLAARWFRPLSGDALARERQRLLASAPIPGLWLFGKAQSGKSTVVRFLTGAEQARIGKGYRPETRRTEEYAFPSAESPLVRFFDTRGLGEADDDPTEDLRALDAKTHLVIVTVRITDLALEAVVGPLKRMRSQRPERPVLLLLTCLHLAYPGREHPEPDPFERMGDPSFVPEPVRRLLANHRERFNGLVDRIEPIDITPPEEGFSRPDFGGERLKQALLDLLPSSYAETIRRLDALMGPLRDLHERTAAPYIQSYALMAAGAAAVPIPWIDVPAVVGLQASLIREIGRIYHQDFGVEQFLSMAGVFGARLVLRQGVRELLKAIPLVGSAANAALAYATTFGLGKAACWYFGRRLSGQVPTTEEFRKVLAEQMRLAEALWKQSSTEGRRS